MDFMSTQTVVNLARAFAGESQARNRYCFYADQAARDGLYALEELIREIARNEYAHAKVFFDHIATHAPSVVDNINLDSGYPFQILDTTQNMLFASKGEHDEGHEIYPKFAEIAKEEGFPEIAASFTMISKIELQHEHIFVQLHEQLKNGTMYKSQTPITWKCAYCGHTHSLTEPWQVCPVCGRGRGYVQIHLSTTK